MHFFTVTQFYAFVAFAVICILAPGPDNLAVLSLGISRGRKAGIGFGIGCGLGCLTHTTWAALGVAAVIAASSLAFLVMKAAGALYLGYLGVKALRSQGATLSADLAEPEATGRYIARGFLANAMNPKVALFFLALLPQFANPRGAVALQMLLLGACFGALSAAIFSLLGHYSGYLGEWLRRRQGFSVWMDRLTGCLFIGLGIRLALVRR